MDNNETSIHEFDFALICEYFSTLDRQGPGSPEVTRKALSFIDNLDENANIADIGCGTGGQTMTLAEHTTGQITGVDLFPVFIDLFNANVRKAELQDRMKGIVASMEALPFEDKAFDLLWSEGAIYNIGFQQGLEEWRRFLKPGGYIAVSEASWFTEERPDEIENFWRAEYPGIDTISRKVEIMQKAGYVPVAAFTLPENCWIDNYYVPQVPMQEQFVNKYAGNKTAEEFVANQRHEAELYYKYKQYYGYVFYIGRKI